MNKFETNRKKLNQWQTELRQVMTGFDQPDEAMRLFFDQHARLHSAKVSQTDLWSFEDGILDGLTDEQFRRIPSGDEHSIIWCIWHLARIEDVTMNLLVAGRQQVFNQDNWPHHLLATACDTGNAMMLEDVEKLSAALDIDALRAYRVAVGWRTRQIVEQLQPEYLIQRVAPARLRRIMDEGVLLEAASGIADYWGKRTIAGLLLMPATRHNIVHLNEALQLKSRK